ATSGACPWRAARPGCWCPVPPTTGAAAWSLATRVPLKVDVLRDRASLAREADDGSIENVFRLQITNVDEQPRTFLVSAAGLDGMRLSGDREIRVEAASTASATIELRVEAGAARAGANPVRIRVEDAHDPAVTVTEDAKFWMP
ncbi:MAG: hypothetical protein HGA47_11790, partial [Zoogloea sp.]|nr:hypothetical protein [Zoogloea sp.]